MMINTFTDKALLVTTKELRSKEQGLLCRAHNLLEAERVLGRELMGKYVYR